MIYYFAPADLQVARVDRQCIVRFCEALKQIGEDVTLISAKIRLAKYEPEETDLIRLYGIQTPFTIILLPSILHQTSNPYWKALVRLVVYTIYIIRTFSLKKKNDCIQQDVLYFKNYLFHIPLGVLRWCFGKRVKVIFESHLPPKNGFQRYVLRRVDGIIANSHRLAEKLIREFGVPEAKIIGTHQGVNLNYVESIRKDKMECRRRTGLPLTQKLAVYTGKVYEGYEEIEYFVEAARWLSPDIEIVIVGGRADHVERLRERYRGEKALHFIGFVRPSEVFYYQFAADMLLLYYAPGNPLNDFRSPGKLFDYMASGNPIISADYPVLREILRNAGNSLLVPIANPKALAHTICKLAADEALCRRIATQARADIEEFTWVARASKIAAFIRILD